MAFVVYSLLGLLVVLSLSWFKTPRPSRVKVYLLVTLLVATVFSATLLPPVGSPAIEYLGPVALLAGGLGGSVPAAYCVGLLGAQPGGADPTHQLVKGRIGPFRFKAKIMKSSEQVGVAGGGRLIGICERLAVILCLMTSQVNLLAVIVAVKGLARYPDIKAGHLTAEKFIVGTFVSLLWAAGCALIAINLR